MNIIKLSLFIFVLLILIGCRKEDKSLAQLYYAVIDDGYSSFFYENKKGTTKEYEDLISFAIDEESMIADMFSNRGRMRLEDSIELTKYIGAVQENVIKLTHLNLAALEKSSNAYDDNRMQKSDFSNNIVNQLELLRIVYVRLTVALNESMSTFVNEGEEELPPEVLAQIDHSYNKFISSVELMLKEINKGLVENYGQYANNEYVEQKSSAETDVFELLNELDPQTSIKLGQYFMASYGELIFHFHNDSYSLSGFNKVKSSIRTDRYIGQGYNDNYFYYGKNPKTGNYAFLEMNRSETKKYYESQCLEYIRKNAVMLRGTKQIICRPSTKIKYSSKKLKNSDFKDKISRRMKLEIYYK